MNGYFNIIIFKFLSEIGKKKKKKGELYKKWKNKLVIKEKKINILGYHWYFVKKYHLYCQLINICWVVIWLKLYNFTVRIIF